ncbi:MAG TPA: 4-hydroxy-tetrahydrodipicolinate reductase [Gemmataceae bacterium]|nr:4-hydroxy-tetrahydrodipicolinate reductase [Gemmataceae bacterium]
MKTVIGINGACGRMGQRLIHLAHEDPALTVGAALEAPGHPRQGHDAGEVCGIGKIGIPVRHGITPDLRLEVVIDFSVPEGTLALLPQCVAHRIPIVIATTGFSAEQRREVEEAAHEIALLQSPNMSLVVNVLFKLVREAGTALKGKGFDVEIIERHHRYKKDSPSGTALHFARIVQEAMGQTELRHGREGLVGERPPQEIGLHAVRAGDNVGEHTILFSALGETMELVHKSSSRDSYARGALEAAKFLAGKPAGRYTMDDVLGL